MFGPFTEFLKDNFVPPRRGQVPEPDGKRRIEFIDLAKGVCILLVVMMHANLAVGIPALRALRMPLYFMLSGLFFKDYGSFLNFTVKKVNRILTPFLFFAFAGLAVATAFRLADGRPAELGRALAEPFVRPTMGRSNLPLWFLVCLFWANLLYCGISLGVRSPGGRALCVALCGAAGYGLSAAGVYLPLFAGSALTALPFLFAGTMLRRLPLLYAGCHDGAGFVLGLALGGACVAGCVAWGTPYIEFRTNVFAGPPLRVFALSVALVVSLLLVCKRVGWLPVVSYLGRYSIVVLGLHFIALGYAHRAVAALTGCDCRADGCRLALTLALCWLAIPLCRAFLPKLTAQADWLRLPRR